MPHAPHHEPEDVYQIQQAQLQAQLQSPPRPIRISTIAVVQVFIALLTFGITFGVLKADVDRMQVEQSKAAVVNMEILRKVTELESTVGFLRDEMRYYRDKTDRITEGRNTR